MACRIINSQTGDVISLTKKKTIPDYSKWYDFDSGEEALLELIVNKCWLTLTDETLNAIKIIVHPLQIRGVILPTHFKWRKYIFSELGRSFGYVGEMCKPQKINQPLKKPNLSRIDWDLYSEEERGKIFTDIYESLGLKPEPIIHEEINKSPVVCDKDIERLNQMLHPQQAPARTIVTKIPNLPTQKEEHVVYILYCDDTPNIYYVGRTKNIQQRFKSHEANHEDQNTELKWEWVDYINQNNHKLKYKILKLCNKDNVHSCEGEIIRKYVKDRSNIVLNFTTTEYDTNNSIFKKRFKACLYEKKIICIENFWDTTQSFTTVMKIKRDDDLNQFKLSQPIKNSAVKLHEDEDKVRVIALTSSVTPKKMYVTHAFARTDLNGVIERNMKSSYCYGEKRDWIDEVKNLGGELEVKLLETCEEYNYYGKTAEHIKKLHDEGFEIVNGKSDLRMRLIDIKN